LVRTNRLEAFSDGVLAIIITIMVLELRVPTGHDFSSLIQTSGTSLLTYLLSFVYVGIYWNNHHHMFQLVHRVSGGMLWANLALLFWLSLFPFTTSWMDHSHFERPPVLAYGVNLLLAGIAYFVLQQLALKQEGPDSALRRALGRDLKGRSSPVLYVIGILAVLFIDPEGRTGVWIALGCYVFVSILWVIPDRRIDRVVRELGTPE
jgi:uncharacterized membrane protein